MADVTYGNGEKATFPDLAYSRLTKNLGPNPIGLPPQDRFNSIAPPLPQIRRSTRAPNKKGRDGLLEILPQEIPDIPSLNGAVRDGLKNLLVTQERMDTLSEVRRKLQKEEDIDGVLRHNQRQINEARVGRRASATVLYEMMIHPGLNEEADATYALRYLNRQQDEDRTTFPVLAIVNRLQRYDQEHSIEKRDQEIRGLMLDELASAIMEGLRQQTKKLNNKNTAT